MIDLHCHVLAGIDDGPATIEGALALARLAAGGGTEAIVATPHVNWRYRNDSETIAALVTGLGEQLRGAGVRTRSGAPLEVRAGAEVALTAIAELEPGELARLTLGGGPWLLVEPPFAGLVPNLDGLLLDVQARGHRVVLAHPERCPTFRRDPPMLARLVRAGMLTSITASSLGGRFGVEARDFAVALAREGLMHNVASDAHDDSKRPPQLAEELANAGLSGLTPWLTVEVPQAILAGEKIPPRPPRTAPSQRRRSRWPRARRA